MCNSLCYIIYIFLLDYLLMHQFTAQNLNLEGHTNKVDFIFTKRSRVVPGNVNSLEGFINST